jgi:SAM-dependent methyltransferase
MERSDDVVLSIPDWYPFKNVERTVDRRDGMFANNIPHYFRVGLSALAAIENATKGVEPKAILDMSCGFGRVGRALRVKFPDARMTVCDIIKEGVDFCASRFDARGVYSTSDFNALKFNETYDLIWVGSLVTHIDAKAIVDFVGFALRHLSPAGAAVVTSHGDFVAGRVFERWRAKGAAYGIPADRLWPMMQSFFNTGFAYADYPSQKGYGTTFCSEVWLRGTVANAGGTVTSYVPHFWDNHHDVVSFTV